MKKKTTNKRKRELIQLHVYGIFDLKKRTIIKISLDPTELGLDFALMGGPSEYLIQCEFDVKVAL